MYDDSPDWRVLFNMLESLYQNHPVKIDIAGTVESIAEITADTLYSCYSYLPITCATWCLLLQVTLILIQY